MRFAFLLCRLFVRFWIVSLEICWNIRKKSNGCVDVTGAASCIGGQPFLCDGSYGMGQMLVVKGNCYGKVSSI